MKKENKSLIKTSFITYAFVTLGAGCLLAPDQSYSPAASLGEYAFVAIALLAVSGFVVYAQYTQPTSKKTKQPSKNPVIILFTVMTLATIGFILSQAARGLLIVM